MTSLRVLPGSAGTTLNDASNAPRLGLVPPPPTPEELVNELYMLAYLEGMENRAGACPHRSRQAICDRLERIMGRVSGR